MPAAAEALPGTLEEATRAGLSHTELLERPLAMEVAAVYGRRRASLAALVVPALPLHLATPARPTRYGHTQSRDTETGVVVMA